MNSSQALRHSRITAGSRDPHVPANSSNRSAAAVGLGAV